MSTFDSTGITLDSLSEIKEKLLEKFKESFGENIKTSDDSVFGQLAGIMSEVVADQNELIMQVAQMFNPQSASGKALSDLVLLNGITRNEAEYSTVSLKCTANSAGCTIPVGSLVSDPNNSSVIFETDLELVLGSGASDYVSATAIESGSIEAEIGTLTKIENPIYGWASVTNEASASIGEIEERDTPLRSRRKIASFKCGECSIAAIYTAVNDIQEVERLLIYENNTNLTDSNGVPPQHIWAIVKGGDDQDIAQALFENVSAGIGYYGSTEIDYNDPISGETYTIKFSRPTEKTVYIKILLEKNGFFPSDGDNTIKQNIVDFFNGEYTMPNGINHDGFSIGDNIITTYLYTPVNAVEGHYVTGIYISFSPTPTLSANLEILPDEMGVASLTDIEIVEV